MRPNKIHLHKQSNTLELHFGEQVFELSAEILRVHSSSAEVKGHGPGQEVLVDSKKEVEIQQLHATGNYGIRIEFSDRHDSGIFTWSYLKELCKNRDPLWESYLEKLQKAGKSRDPHTSVVQFLP